MSSFKKTLFGQFAHIGRALGSAHRLELLELLAQGERPVEAMAAVVGLPIANVSQHLQYLRRAGLVATRKEGQFVHYRLAHPAVADLVSALGRVAESQVKDVQRLVRDHLTARDDIEPISRVELSKRLREGSVTVVDVRPPEEYAAGHVPGAINLPLRNIGARLEGLPKRREVIAYCRGPYCVMAFEAVARLRRQGIKARRLEDGYPEWARAGFPIERRTEDR
jgi:rhodanese-related sulfurtransferase/DNA-binding transcriptional ArsR family regulator